MRNLDTLPLPVDGSVIMYALIGPDGKRWFGCKVKSASGKTCGEMSDHSPQVIAEFAVRILEKLARMEKAEQFAVFFPDDSVISANTHGQLHLCEGMSRVERNEVWLDFAAEFRRLGLDKLYSGGYVREIS